jgi:hypothetical protein
MADSRTISQLEAEGYPWIGCECCKGKVWVPFKMIRSKILGLGAWTLDELGAKMKSDKCGKRLERYERRAGLRSKLLVWENTRTPYIAAFQWNFYTQVERQSFHTADPEADTSPYPPFLRRDTISASEVV